MSNKKSSLDLTQGNITKQIIIFALPILAGQIFQNLYNSVDSIVVGNYVGKTALAAVGAGADITQLLVGFFTGLSIGAGVLFSRYFGQKNYEKVHDSIHTALTFALILGFTMSTIGILFTPQLLNIVDCPPDVMAEATAYLRIYLIGVLFTSIYNVGSGVLRSVGDSKHPFMYLVISSVTNILLDLLFVPVLKMGVTGVGLATVLSQSLSCALLFQNMLTTKDEYKLVIKDLKIDKDLLFEVISLGLPAAMQSCLLSFSNLFVSRYINSFGSSAMAGIGAAKKVDKFVGMIAQSIGLAMATYVSQNVGAKKYGRVHQGIKVTFIMCIVCWAVLGTLSYVFADFTIGLFTKDVDALSYGVSMVRVMMPFYCFQSFNQIYSNTVRGFGKSSVVMILSLIGMVGIRQLFLAITMAIEHNVTFVYIAYPVGWFFSALFVYLYFIFKIKPNNPVEDVA